MIDEHHGWNTNFIPIVVGFVLSILLTLAAYFLVVDQSLIGWSLILTISLLAVVQAVVQLIFFFHIGLEGKPRWNLMSFLFTLLVILIVIGGSLWIMHNLAYNLMPTNAERSKY